MKTVRTFGNLAEAGFASSLLEAAGIHALIADEQTFSIGYGNATGGLRVQVEDGDLERAARVLEDGPDAAVAASGESTAEELGLAAQDRIPIGLFLAGAAVLALMLFAGRSAVEQRRAHWPAGEQTYDYDYNHDGKPDHFFTYRGDRIVSSTADRNFDGKVDEWQTFDTQGTVERAELDDNFDGRPDTWIVYKNGVPTTEKRDTDFNGRVDWVMTYENGITVRADCTPNESGGIVRRLVLVDNVLREEWVDENRDGIFDYKILHDPFGATSGPIPIQAGK